VIAARQHDERCVSWRTDPDGMITITARLTPEAAGNMIAVVDQAVMADRAPAGASLGQQRADALVGAVTNGGGNVDTEVVIHVRPDGNTLADGTPLADHAVTKTLPTAFVSLLVHDMEGMPIDASPRRRHPSRRQRRVIDERQTECQHPGCTAHDFLQYDHIRPYGPDGLTVLHNLQRLCGPHNRAKGAVRTPSNARSTS
jgi:hypothetical protein